MKYGRFPEFDKRSRKFPIRPLIAATQRRSYTWSCGVVLNQGNVGACTGFSVAGEAAARPVIVPNITNKVGMALYKRAQQLDEWPGENYEGSSVLAAIKAGAEKGWYPEYRWAFGEDDLAMAVGWKGPCVLGINWLEGMEEVDKRGFIHATGHALGGHAILCNGISVKGQYYRLHNSWGPKWGFGGECFISWDDMKNLLKDEGEACIPVRRGK